MKTYELCDHLSEQLFRAIVGYFKNFSSSGTRISEETYSQQAVYFSYTYKTSLISFLLESPHPHDAAMILDEEAVAVRAGHHCAQPVIARYGVPPTLRANFAMYNNKEDVDRLVVALARVALLFGQ